MITRRSLRHCCFTTNASKAVPVSSQLNRISNLHTTWLGLLRADWTRQIRLHGTYINSQRLLSRLCGFSRLVMWQQSPGCATDALEKTGSAASSRGRLLTVLRTTQPAGVPTMNSSEPSLMPKKIPSKNLSVIWIFFLLASKYKIFCHHAEGTALE